MNKKVLIFPNQLFEDHPCLKDEADVFLVEEQRYFLDFKFHKKKLIFHRASMRAYRDFLIERGHRVHYIESGEDWRSELANRELSAARPFDHKLEESLPGGITLLDPPSFLGGDLKKSKRYLMAGFYKKQRRRLGILMDDDKPKGGKWSFDKENRKKLPRDHKVPRIEVREDSYIEEAVRYVKSNFPDNPGGGEDFIYPVTFEDSREWLRRFVDQRLEFFGDYEDAISQEKEFIYHSVLSPLLNAGLLTPFEVMEEVLKAKVPINSKEGFIRQIIGWREFILRIYLLEGERQRKSNFFEHSGKVPSSFYDASTGVPPVDNVIGKVLKNAYCHHIERLMILGNFMLLSRYDPEEIYRWFMEMFIDAYDWVMVPNVFGMSQYVDGGLMSSKPYISSSNYILKMSDFSRGRWCGVWDDLFWDFIRDNRKVLKKNPRMALMVRMLDKRK